jgi:predicted TIM-barrel fold metal-dependent hydrolase
MDKQTGQRIQELINFLESNQDILVIDADTHATDVQHLHEAFREKYASGPDYYHGKPVSAEELMLEMELASVSMCLIWQNPAATFYPGDKQGNFESLLAANKYIHESAVKYPQQFIPAGWTDPLALGMDNALRLVDICVHEFGFLVIKLNPAQNGFPIDSEAVYKLVDRIIGLGAVPAFHYGADTTFTSPEGLMRIAEKYQGHPVIAVHMGGGGAGYRQAEEYYLKTREAGLRYPDLKFVLSSRRDTHTESDLITYQLAGEPFSGNLFCASDAPYGRITWNFGGFRWMLLSLMDADHHTDERIKQNPGLFDEGVMRNYLGGNFARFLIAAYKNLLYTHTHHL